MKVIVIRPQQAPVVEEYPGDTVELDLLHSVVGEPVDVRRLTRDADVWFNDEGLLNGMLANRRVPTNHGSWELYGPLLICGRSGADNIGLTEEQIPELLKIAASWELLPALPAVPWRPRGG